MLYYTLLIAVLAVTSIAKEVKLDTTYHGDLNGEIITETIEMPSICTMIANPISGKMGCEPEDRCSVDADNKCVMKEI